VRERGWHGLGQPLKSLRDHPIDFPPYREGFAASPAFSGLGPLQKPGLARPGGWRGRPRPGCE